MAPQPELKSLADFLRNSLLANNHCPSKRQVNSSGWACSCSPCNLGNSWRTRTCSSCKTASPARFATAQRWAPSAKYFHCKFILARRAIVFFEELQRESLPQPEISTVRCGAFLLNLSPQESKPRQTVNCLRHSATRRNVAS